jgi:hypothetical protein
METPGAFFNVITVAISDREFQDQVRWRGEEILLVVHEI